MWKALEGNLPHSGRSPVIENPWCPAAATAGAISPYKRPRIALAVRHMGLSVAPQIYNPHQHIFLHAKFIHCDTTPVAAYLIRHFGGDANTQSSMYT